MVIHAKYHALAFVSCKVPLSSGAEAFSFAYFGAGVGPTHLDNVQCVGNENTILACPSNPIGNENCGHNADAGVRCPGRNVPQIIKEVCHM